MLGDWRIDVATRRLSRADECVTLEPRPMAVLVALCRQPGVVVSAESLLQQCWPEAPAQGDNPVHKVVAGLRRALHDSATEPVYLETIRKRGYRLVAPIRVLSEQGPRSHAEGWRGQSPFRGLEPFDLGHASVFFGRDAAVAELRSRLDRQWRRGHPLVMLLGPSGSGKTSLVQAGLLPALLEPVADATDGAVLHVCTTATVDLGALGRTADGTVPDTWAGLAGALLDWDYAGVPLLSGYSIDSLSGALRERPEEVVRQLEIGLDAIAGPRTRLAAPPLLVLDRLESLLQEDPAHVGAWLATLGDLLRSGRILVLGVCRNDFYAALARQPLLMEDKEAGAHFDLAPPGAGEIAQIIRLPARAAGLSYGSDDSGLNRLDDRLCVDAMRSPEALPLLQYTLQQLYLNREPGDILAWASYEALGGLEGAIGRRAEALLHGLPAARQSALSQLLSRLVTLAGDEAAPTSRWMPDDELVDADERALVEALVEARLLVADLASSGKGYRVAHEALLRRWPRVTAWVASHRAALVARDGLVPWVARWVESGRSGALLLPRGDTLWTVTRALAEAPGLFGPQESDFVRRSQRRLRRQRWSLGAATAGALLLAAAAVTAAVGYSHQADLAAERDRQSRQLASFMLGELADDLRPIGKLNLLGRIGEQGLKVLATPDGKGAASAAADTLQRARALVVIGEVNSSRGHGRTDIAVDALNAARQMLEDLAPRGQLPDLDAGDYFRTLGAASFWLGQISFDAGELDAATEAMSRYREASARWRQLVPGDPAATAELGYALNSLGSITFRRGLWEAAQRWFQESLALKQDALSRAPADVEALEGVANSRTWLGLVAHVRGRPIEALQHYDAARQERIALAQGRGDEQLRLRDLGTLDLRRAEAMRAAGRLLEAVVVMTAGVERLRAAERHDPSNAYWRIDRLHAESHLALARLDAGQPVDADLTELTARLQGTSDTDPAREFQRKEALLRVVVAAAQRAASRGDWPAVERMLGDSAESFEDLLRQRPSYWQMREIQARRALLTLGIRDARGVVPAATNCVRLREGLQSTVDGGQAGLALQAWLAARTCAAGEGADALVARRLVADGYLPLTLPSTTAAQLSTPLSKHP
ncbi:winged helix-turn-helix domain-containing protein [Roseateles asaccharophilus]|uniref:DNA-binding winged helix-turn-helix (WHTH) protein/tetratricopeptide (TPR) repeat protein n=1 Tax=Roseateles asaccharophilus TaxID=582607 RepID=A0ABU2ABJ6_9BURK|nr:winged helix-turn-helix domain-containing protein [Roseateles asaccharophilus]MDR7334582.1 DNA-binding winged helix-turn-helix (wHTH) protein/tetratricopeptide (TPR) repeat protein [Roseateles asaccharophilus]